MCIPQLSTKHWSLIAHFQTSLCCLHFKPRVFLKLVLRIARLMSKDTDLAVLLLMRAHLTPGSCTLKRDLIWPTVSVNSLSTSHVHLTDNYIVQFVWIEALVFVIECMIVLCLMKPRWYSQHYVHFLAQTQRLCVHNRAATLSSVY